MADRRKKRRRSRQHNMLVLRLLILVLIVLVVFEGRLIHTMFSVRKGEPSAPAAVSEKPVQEGSAEDNGSDGEEGSAGSDSAAAAVAQDPAADSVPADGTSEIALAGLTLSNAGSGSGEQNPSSASQSEYIDSEKVVPQREETVDDSYFSNAVFIGDSRMEGFRNTSGITQGTFLTSVGMTLTSISDTMVQTADGNITVYQGLSGIQYGKIYLMLGTNDLGFYPMEEFLPTAISVLNQFHELQPNAMIYICSVIYVEESKVVTDYVNNENVVKVNEQLLKACEELPWCYYLNLNEILSDGYHSLIPGASQDGVHLYPDYSKLMLNYLKSHYVGSPDADTAATAEAVQEVSSEAGMDPAEG